MMLLVVLTVCAASVQAAVVRKRKMVTSIELDLNRPSAIPLSQSEISLLRKGQEHLRISKQVVSEDGRFAHIRNDSDDGLTLTLFGTKAGVPHEVVHFDNEVGLTKTVIPIDETAGNEENLPPDAPRLPDPFDVRAYESLRDDGKHLISVKQVGGKLEVERRKVKDGVIGDPVYRYKGGASLVENGRIVEITNFTRSRKSSPRPHIVRIKRIDHDANDKES